MENISVVSRYSTGATSQIVSQIVFPLKKEKAGDAHSIHNVTLNVTLPSIGGTESSFRLPRRVARYSVTVARYRGAREPRDGPAGFAFSVRKARPKRKAGGLFNFPQNGVLLAPRPSLVPRSDKANRAAPVAPQ